MRKVKRELGTLDAGKPLAHMFAVDGVTYAYDVYSNEIVELEGEEPSLLEEVLAPSFSQDNPVCGDGRAERLRAFLLNAKALGIFQSVPMRGVATPPSKEQIAHELDSHVMSACLEVTQNCNLACKYCHFTDTFDGFGISGHSAQTMSVETAEAAVDFYFSRTEHLPGSRAISFYGGEPLLAASLIAHVVDYVSRTRPGDQCTFHLTTNGVMLAKFDVRELLATNEISIIVSVDGPSRIHDIFRRTKAGRPTHDLISSGLEALRAEYPAYYAENVRFNAVVVSPLLQREIVDYFADWSLSPARRMGLVRYSGVDTIGSQTVLEELGSRLSKIVPSSAPHSRFREDFVSNRKARVAPNDGLEQFGKDLLLRIAKRSVGPIPDAIAPSGFCIPGTRKLFVATDGRLGVCEKVGRESTIGSLRDGFDVDRIHSVLSNYYSFWSGECSSCIAQRLCGACPAVLKGKDGEISVDRFADSCVGQTKAIEKSLRDYVEIGIANPSYVEALESTLII